MDANCFSILFFSIYVSDIRQRMVHGQWVNLLSSSNVIKIITNEHVQRLISQIIDFVKLTFASDAHTCQPDTQNIILNYNLRICVPYAHIMYIAFSLVPKSPQSSMF